MPATTTMTIRLTPNARKKLEKLARATGRSKSFLAAEAIQAYLDMEAWQIKEIKKGLQEADAGDFATDTEVEAVLSKWR